LGEETELQRLEESHAEELFTLIEQNRERLYWLAASHSLEGRLREAEWVNGRKDDLVVYGLLASERGPAIKRESRRTRRGAV
jgi:hypothetical protein